MKKYYLLFALTLAFLLHNLQSTAQCFTSLSPSTNMGMITPDSTWQVLSCVYGGEYYEFAAEVGKTYIFSFCTGGGSVAFNTELTINDMTGIYVAPGYNDNACGVASELYWTASTSGTYQIFITQFFCMPSSMCGNLAYRVASEIAESVIPTNDAPYDDPVTLVESILANECIPISNVSYTGNANAIGYFQNGADLGIEEGLILSSGDISNVLGPNNNTGAGTAWFSNGDPDLDALTTSFTTDAAVLEFDFEAQGDSMRFNYVFASEEYLEWTGSQFNDVF